MNFDQALAMWDQLSSPLDAAGRDTVADRAWPEPVEAP